MTKSESRASVGVIQSDREAAAALFGTTPWSKEQFLSGKRDMTDRVQAFAAYRVQIERGASAHVPDGWALVPVKWTSEMYSIYHGREDYAKPGRALSISDWWPHFLEAAAPPLQSPATGESSVVGVDTWEGKPADGPAEQRLRNQREPSK